MNCDWHDCDQPATSRIQWGKDLTNQSGNFCQAHIRELWQTVQPQVLTNVCLWIQKPA